MRTMMLAVAAMAMLTACGGPDVPLEQPDASTDVPRAWFRCSYFDCAYQRIGEDLRCAASYDEAMREQTAKCAACGCSPVCNQTDHDC